MKNKENIINILAISVCIIIFAVIHLKYTFPVNFQNADNYNEDLTAYSLNFVNNWLIDGISSDKFITYCDFASVEFENNNNRSVYLSYPPGAFVPLFLIAKATGKKEVSISFVKYFVQFEYYISMLLLGLLFYICLKKLEVTSQCLMIVFPVIFSSLWAFLPYNVYYMNNIYFADQAVIVLAIMFFLIEIALYNKQVKRWDIPLQILSCMVLFIGILTDYYFFCIASVIICFRVMNAFQEHPEKSTLFKLFSNTWYLLLTVITASALFFIQLINVPDGIKLLVVTYLMRTDSGAEWGGINTLLHHMGNGFTVLFIPVLMFTAIFCLIFPFIRKKYNKEKQIIVNGVSIIVLSTVLHTVILREHSIIHEFSMLKYNLVFTFIIFVFTCWIYINYKTAAVERTKISLKIILTSIVFLIVFCIAGLKSYDKHFNDSRIMSMDHSIARLIQSKTTYYDVLYSPDCEIHWNPPQDLAISRKRIYKVLSLDEIPVGSLPDHAIVNILISRKTIENHNWSKLNTERIFSEKLDNFYLFKFTKKSFQSIIKLK